MALHHHSPAQRRKIKRVMGEFKRGTLMSGSGGKVKSRKQAVAVALNEARRGKRRETRMSG